MTRNHRRWHAWAWLVLGPLVAAAFVACLLARPAPVAAPGNTPNAAAMTQPREATP
jgi:hypothetical protein